MFNVPTWVILLIGLVVVPILKKVVAELEKTAAQTPETWDDILVGALSVVIDFFSGEGVFIPKSRVELLKRP